MRGRAIIMAAMLLAASCIPSPERPEKPRPEKSRQDKPKTATSKKQLLQCHADLRREDIEFKPLPDRRFDGGCSALGSVQLLEIGTPVSNLGAMTCPLARSFADWTREAVQPAARAWLGSRVIRIESFGTYSCRPVNGQAGNKLSEHGHSNAVDIAAFVLDDGRKITVLDGWGGGDEDAQRFLRAVHQAGCRRFKIVLGPDANGFHRNHFHFDMGQGPYCR